MKRKIFTALAAFAALALISCSMTTIQENDIEEKNTYLTVGLNSEKRTALPGVNAGADFTKFTLTGTSATEGAAAVNQSWDSDSESTAYAKMTAANIEVTKDAEYSFTLSAIKGGAKWQGTATKTIEEGANSLSFTLALAELSAQGSGSINIALSVPSAVQKVDAALKSMDESESITPEDAALTFENGKATYTASNVAAGNYVLVFTLWGDTEKTLNLAQWREYAGVTNGLTSTSNPVIASNDDLKNICTVNFSSDGSNINVKTVTGGSKVTSPVTPTKASSNTTNYTFADWYTSTDNGATLSATAFDFDTLITENITLYAKWNESTRYYTVWFIGNNNESIPPQSVEYNHTISNFNITKNGSSGVTYTFAGWYILNNGTLSSTAFDVTTPITEEITLSAKWTANYSVTFNANGGAFTTDSGNVTSINKSISEVSQLPTASSLKLSYNDYDFTGWNTAADGSGTSYAEDANITGPLTLYAQWEPIPLTLEAIEAGTITIKNPWSTLKYRKNRGTLTAVTVTDETANPPVATIEYEAGDKIQFFAVESENRTDKLNLSYMMIINCTSDCYAYGNIMSLITLNESTGLWNKDANTVTECAFLYLFYENTNIKNKNSKALKLPATSLAKYCYMDLFCGCTGLTTAPELPATTLAQSCYSSMFARCTSLTQAPELPATNLADECYKFMFSQCNITSAPELPVTALAKECYAYMFNKCTNLTQAPELPATNLEKGCYHSMFSGCSSLTQAPELPATTIATDSYESMFKDCSSLNYIKCLATNRTTAFDTNDWLKNVSSSGTFVKANGAEFWKTGTSNIPSDWEVQEE